LLQTAELVHANGTLCLLYVPIGNPIRFGGNRRLNTGGFGLDQRGLRTGCGMMGNERYRVPGGNTFSA
jgi:hypothetical protein